MNTIKQSQNSTNIFIALFLSILFFLISLFTLADYGVNWDAISHLSRGQAFLHFILTGKENYRDVPEWNLYKDKEEQVIKETAGNDIPRQRLYFQNIGSIFFDPDISKNEIPRISIYQYPDDIFQNISKRYEFGHPHISDVLSSVFNYILFQKLGLLNDVDSYRVYSVFLASLLVGLIFWWTAYSYGKFAGFVAVLSLCLYPLFWAEAHFNNEKDIPETVYWSFFIFSVWWGVTTKSAKWLFSSGIFFGLALGTKFNILFSVFVIFPWSFFYLLPNCTNTSMIKFIFKKYKGPLLAFITAPFIGIFIFIGTWPNFFQDPIGKTLKIIDFYRTIGTASGIDQRFISFLGINTYAIQWIIFTTPIVILFFSSIGVLFFLIKRVKEKQMQTLLFFLWLLVPIIRVMWPGTNIYGGVRHIMEFIPAMAIFSGIGSSLLVKWLQQVCLQSKMLHFNLMNKMIYIFVVVAFIPILLKLIQIHPNENVYFNPLIGGLSGAKEQNFPGWGVSFGSPYREAVEWVNKNAETNAKLTLGHEILSNIPGIFIRPDIQYKSNRSGYLQQGEYVISLRFHGTDRRSYFDMYLDRLIDPVYQKSVDDVPILKIWKNSKEYLRPQWRNESHLEDIKFINNKIGISFDLGKEVKLSRLEIEYDNNECPELAWGYFMISKDGDNWERIPGVLPEEVRIKMLGVQPSNGKFIEPFVGQEARYIDFHLSPIDTCVTKIKSVKLDHFI